MYGKVSKRIVLLGEGFLYGLALLLYRFSDVPGRLAPRYSATLYICFGLSLLCSCALLYARSPFHAVAVALARMVLISIVGYPFPQYLGVEIVLLSGFLVEVFISLKTRSAAALFAVCGVLTLACLAVPRNYVFADDSVRFLSLGAAELLSLGFFIVVAECSAILLKAQAERTRAQREGIEQLTTNIDSLIRANLAFQEYADSADVQAAQKERERITREIHDSSGYAFTNLIALMEVGISLGVRDTEKLTELFYQAKAQAQEGLQETRSSLRRLRAADEDTPVGIKALMKVLSTFEQVTNVHIDLQLGNAKWTYGRSIDAAIYRIIQEALTNSFRHGRARTVWINLWEHEEALIMNIRDDGRGAETIEEGIGLKGMEERVSQFGGAIEIPETMNGFHLVIRLPLREGKE